QVKRGNRETPFPPWSAQNVAGSVPAMKTSSTEAGQPPATASSPLSGSIVTDAIPAGRMNGCGSRYPELATARFMNSAQIGAAAAAPDNPSSRLSSKPTQTAQTRFDVNPANQPSWEVPVLPAAGAVNPCARTPAPVPRLMTS